MLSNTYPICTIVLFMSQNNNRTLQLRHFFAYRMVNLSRLLSDSLSEVYLQKFKLTIPEWLILATLAEHQSLNAKQITEMTFMDKTKVSRAVNQMSNAGYLEKSRDKDDQRAIHLSLSKQGYELYHNVVPHILDWETRLLENISAPEYRDLLATLDKLEQGIKNASDTQ